MKPSKLREMNAAELNKKLAELKRELLNLRFQNATGQLTNLKQIDACKKDIARVMTILRELELKG
ncbi:MAG: 50S ribosomal protein L29 [Clostridiales bacterium]|nr:50S ribosomal protein L29 [Clostridiales bacterium]